MKSPAGSFAKFVQARYNRHVRMLRSGHRLDGAAALIGALALLLVPMLPARAQDSVSGIVRVRIGVTEDGVVRLSAGDLQSVGVNVEGLDPRTFAVSSLGRPVAIRITGEDDGRLDPGDRIEFFGQRFRGPEMDQKYTDERVYWLDMGGAPGPRMREVDATPYGDLAPPEDFPTTLYVERSRLWWPLHTLHLDTQDTWFWDRLQPGGPGATVVSPLVGEVPDPAPGSGAVLRVEEIAYAWNDAVSPDHLTTIAMNGVAVAEETWDGKVRRIFTGAVPAGALVSGTNTVTVGAVNPTGIFADDIYVNYWELDYRRLFKASGGQLDFQVENTGVPHEYLVSGWASPQVEVWDVSDEAVPQRLIGMAVEPEGAGSRLRFRTDNPAGARYWLQADETIAGPAILSLRPATGLRNPAGGADAVIVTPASLRPAADILADWHRAHGRRALVADINDVYDEFNDGIHHPKAIPAMLAWAHEHWEVPGPAYLTLIGDGHWNFKGFRPERYPSEPNLIPPFLAWVDPWVGEAPADPLYGDISGDGLPDIPVGRLAVNTLEEALTVVNKIARYDENLRDEEWERRALFVTDNPEPGAAYPQLSDAIIAGYLPPDLQPQRIYLTQVVTQTVTPADIVRTRTAISDALQSGVWMVQYSGHGAIASWASERIWHISDIPALRNGDRLPIMMSFNCLDGYFAYPGQPSISELMQRQAGGGSVAAISPSGLGLVFDQHAFRRLLMEVTFVDGVREIGQALLIAKQRYYALYGWNYQLATVMLFGDPAMRLPVAAPLAGPKHYVPLALKR